MHPKHEPCPICRSLERRVARGGRDSIDHSPGAHDDIANAVAGLAVTLGAAVDHTNLDWIDGGSWVDVHTPSFSERREYSRQQMWSHIMADARRGGFHGF